MPDSDERAGTLRQRFEHDACGVGFVADLTGRRGHDIVAQALTVLRNLDHRGAKGSDPETGDGAGILTQIPDEFFRAVCGFALPEPGCYAAGLVFLPGRRCGRRRRDGGHRAARRRWRAWPSWAGGTSRTTVTACGAGARAVLPRLAQLFVAAAGRRARAWSWTGGRSACASARSTRPACTSPACPAATIVYKGMLTALQLEPFYPDLSDPRYRFGAGPGALQVLDQHVPVLAAGPPVPVHRAQRRDQHDPGQPQLDAGPRGDAGHRPDPAGRRRPRASSGCCRSWTSRRATRPASTRAWNCCTWAAGRCRTRC